MMYGITIWENEDGETEDIEDKTIEGVIKNKNVR